MEKLLTVVVPAYNAEVYIDRCLNSLAIPEIIGKAEVLVVNDGSTDKTLEIAKDYEKRFPSLFKVIDKKNGNYGSVMNIGLKTAEGKYFKTLDSDDWYDTNAFKQFMGELNETEADIIINDYIRYQEDAQSEKRFYINDSVVNSKDIVVTSNIWTSNIVKNYNIHSVCYKTELLRKSGLIWPDKVFYSDIQTLFWPQSFCKTVRFIPVPLYVYIEGRNDQSMSQASKRRNFHSYDIVANNLVDEYLRVYDSNHPMSKIQKSNIIYILKQFYSYLTIPEFQDFNSIIVLDNKLKNDSSLYEFFGKINPYLSALRKGKYSFRFIYLRIRLQLSSIKKSLRL